MQIPTLTEHPANCKRLLRRQVRCASRYSTVILTLTSTITPSRICGRYCHSTPILSDIPTEIKNIPSSSPLNGSMVISSSWRYSVSASITPAINVPSAMENPSCSINTAEPITTSSEAAVKTSLTPILPPAGTMAAADSVRRSAVRQRPES